MELIPTEKILELTKLFWQYPVITEGAFFNQNKNEPKYFGFPWATCIDKRININELFKILIQFKNKEDYLEIQLRKSQSLAEIAVNAQPLDQYVAGKHKRILIAEDNLMNQKIASFFLEKAGYDYLITSNGKEALDAITQGGEFDAILMDCMMPVMDGLTATEEIRRWEDKTKKHKTKGMRCFRIS